VSAPPASETPSEPALRAEVIRQSLQVFSLGIWGMLPLLGLVCGLSAFVACVAARTRYRNVWNPADRYLLAGGTLGLLGFLSSLGLVLVIGTAIAMELAG
jgi:hypothetical protein